MEKQITNCLLSYVKLKGIITLEAVLVLPVTQKMSCLSLPEDSAL